MAEPSSPLDDKPPEFSDSTLIVRSVGIDIAAQHVSVGGDVVGHDKIVTGYTAEQVSALLAQISATFQPRPFDGRCPYLGLDAFGEEDADRFFGREKLVAELVARGLRHWPVSRQPRHCPVHRQLRRWPGQDRRLRLQCRQP